jgi:hypothetical protein
MKETDIEFYVGILPQDFDAFKVLSEKANTEIIKSYDDPHGYFVTILKGSWDSYKELSTNSLVKSIEHFQE